MNIKSIIITVVMLSLMVSCEQPNPPSEGVEPNVQEKLSFDEQFLKDVKEKFGDGKDSEKSTDFGRVMEGIGKIKDNNIRGEVMNVIEEVINRMTEEDSGSTYLRYLFFPEGPEKILFEEYLTNDTIEKIYISAHPVYYEIDKKDLTMVHKDFNKVIKVEESSSEALSWLEENDVKYEHPNGLSEIIVLSESGVIVYLNLSEIINVFKLENNQGENVKIDIVLKEINQILVEKENKRPKLTEEEINEYLGKKNVDKKEIELKKEAGPQIGMIDTEVAEFFGKPSKINRTTTATGIREQWVYPDNTYLYFENGLLTTIQE